VSRALLILASNLERRQAHKWIDAAPTNSRVTFQGPRRTLDQSSKMWAMLTDISRQYRHHGQKLSPDDLKVLFLSALGAELRLVPNLDGTGFVHLGRSSSNLSREEMSNLLDLIAAWGAQNGIVFTDGEGTGVEPNKHPESAA